MRITLRLILSLALVACAGAVVVAALQAHQFRRQLESDLARKASTLGHSLRQSVDPLTAAEKPDALLSLAQRFGAPRGLLGAAVYAPDSRPLIVTPDLPPAFRVIPDVARAAATADQGLSAFVRAADHRWHVYALPLPLERAGTGAFLLVYDAAFVDAEQARFWRQQLTRLLLSICLITTLMLLLVYWSLVRPMSQMVAWMKRLRMGEPPGPLRLSRGALAPLAGELSRMAKTLLAARATAEEEARLRLAGQSRWTAERLKEHVRGLLNGRPFIVIANREPYLHVRQGREITCSMPPSGLVTAVEPILRACGGTWIAHGSGDADRSTADAAGRLKVPPDAPAYTLKRVWLSKEEEEGYYYGFSNEGLWPLCHIAHTRPLFRAEDWAYYQRVNAKFMEAALEELDGLENPYILIQDYHFALLPRMLKERRPDAKIAMFWHIPWPNPEAFDICPWARDLLHGLLGADLLGFHTQFHCNNFLETVDRTLESRIDRERFAINRGDHITWVKPFPISIAFDAEAVPSDRDAAAGTAAVTKALGGGSVELLGVGVDRIDYTKGIVERFRGVERLLEKHPELAGRFTFVQLGAPSRTLIKRYQDLGAELDQEMERINQRFQMRAWKPIVFLKKQHSHQEIQPFYRAANICLVTALHDGMNLVAKEFVAARADRLGALVLSRFTGAARELHDALLVNPYDADQVADAIYEGLMMSPDEQQARMSRMREALQEYNIYRWAANLVTELATIRATPPSTVLTAPSP